ncbi:hypothetical protein [Streptomyces palmae]|uniref:hypothetical protein n=1 Tax=Streptomyces palmae TaxID=1701085 RepID=UPI0014334171|nr:hypothetical protein [Streptomyces palmae]
MFRFDLRSPEEIFKDGFWAWGTGLDLCRHVADFSGYQRISGFISTASDVATAMNMFISWKVKKKELEKAWDIDLKLRQLDIRWDDIRAQIEDKESRQKMSLTPEKELKELAKLLKREFSVLKKVQKPFEDRKKAGWVEIWLYVIKPDQYYISIEENLRDERRRHLVGGRAYQLAGEATEWDAVYHIPPHRILQAIKVKFTRLKLGPGERAELVHDIGLDIKTNERFNDEVLYDPYERSQKRFVGLIGYWAPVDTKSSPSRYGPGSVNFVKLEKDQWEGKSEYQRQGGPRHPFGRPEDIKPAYPAFAKKP